MHGVKRGTKPIKDHAKLADYLALTDEVLSRKEARDFSPEALNLTTRMLHVNPEFYTVWNYRRHILNSVFPSSTPEEINEILAGDLSMTTAALKVNPKVYWIWNHRRWCLENVPDGPDKEPQGWRKEYWAKEMYFVEKMLDADARNFHAWNYRRHVLAGMPFPRPANLELVYTKRKIESNFSNFSAWHHRSKVLASLWEKGELDVAKTKEQEFELVQNAMYTDPEDQSVWMYHRWLVGGGEDPKLLQREINVIQDLLDEQPDSKWCMESLVHYKLILVRKHSSTVDSGALVAECHTLLGSLREVDPKRRNRYDEIEAEL